MALTCKACLKLYPNTSSLHTHIRVVHKTSPSSIGHAEKDWHYICLEKQCRKCFKSSQFLISHLKKQHGYKFDHEEISVGNMDGFFKWKSRIEEDNNCRYILKNTLSYKNYKLLYYRCDQCHKPEQIYKKSRTAVKTYCTSQLKVYKEHHKDTIKVSWIKTHYGHGIEIPNFKSKFDKDNILETIKKVPKENRRGRKRKIKANDISNNILEEDNLQQDYCEEKMNSKIDIKNNCLDNNADNDPILFHKRQGSRRVEHFETNDFCLIIMNDYQKDMLNQFGTNIITIDSTQNLNNHDFDLTTLSVLDEYNQGFPVAYMLCNRKDILTFTFFFKTIKTAVGVVQPKIFITDLIDSYYNAWNNIMGEATHHVFCPWRIEQAWTLDLNKISNVEKRQDVSDIIKTLQKESEEYNFQIMLNDIITYLLEDKDTEQFGKYFKNNYYTNYQKWAFCLHQEYGINSDTNLESMHELTNYFDEVLLKERSFDKVLQTVFKYVQDKTSKRNSMLIKNENPTKFEVECFDSYWKVQDADESYKVEKLSDENCCENICLCCNMCIHMYNCDCPFYQISKMICAHIHYIISDSENNEQSSTRTVRENLSPKKTVNEYPIAAKRIKKENNLDVSKKETIVDKVDIKDLKELINLTYNKLQTVQLGNLNNSIIKNISSHLNSINDLICKNTKNHHKK